jgi:hypothetical protein
MMNKKNKNRFFNEIYTIDRSTGLYMIEIALDRYSDIFNEWDPAPFKRRALDSDLELYLEGSSEEIPLKYPIELCFTLPKGMRDEKIEEESQNGLKNSFVFKIYLLRQKLRKTNAQMLQDVILGFTFLWLGGIISNRFADQAFLSLVGESFFIGGWVFLWEAVSLFFFTNRELYHCYCNYKRLQNAPVIFREAEKLE